MYFKVPQSTVPANLCNVSASMTFYLLSFVFFIIVLKRFTAGYIYRSKLDTDVGIPQTLDLSPYASDDVKGW